jgi:hypothetical protein
VWTNTNANYTPPAGQPAKPQSLNLLGLAVDAANVYWSTPAVVFPPAPSNPVCDAGVVYSMALSGGTPTVINPGDLYTANGPSRLTSDGKNLWGYRTPTPSYTLYGGTSFSVCNPYDIVEMPAAGGSLKELVAFSTFPMFDLPPGLGSDTAADGTHGYYISAWWAAARCVTRDDWATCPCVPLGDLGDGRTCPLVDLDAARIAVDTSYVYVFDHAGTLWRTFK